MIDENKCGGRDRLVHYICAVKKLKKKRKNIYICVRQERKVEKKWINVPFSDDLGGCFEVKV